jgi:hypothetical protein
VEEWTVERRDYPPQICPLKFQVDWTVPWVKSTPARSEFTFMLPTHLNGVVFRRRGMALCLGIGAPLTFTLPLFSVMFIQIFVVLDACTRKMIGLLLHISCFLNETASAF